MKRAQTTGPKMVIFTPLLGQIGGLLGQWPTSYNVKKCPGSELEWHPQSFALTALLALCLLNIKTW